MRKMFLLLLPLLFTSCVWVPVQDYSSIKEKTTYKSFKDIKNPIVLHVEANAEFNSAGSKDEHHQLITIGSVYSIYDFENDKIIDWTFTKSKDFPSYKLQKVFTSDGKVKFLNYDIKEQNIYLMDSEKTSVDVVPVENDEKFSVDYEWESNDVYRYKLFYYEDLNFEVDSLMMTKYRIKFFDADTNTFGKEIIIENSYNNGVNASSYIPAEKGGDGYVWFITWERKDYPERHNFYLNRISPETGILEEKLTVFDGVAGDEVYNWSESKDWNHTLRYKVKDYAGDNLLIQVENCILNDGYEDSYDYFLLNKSTFEKRQIVSGVLTYVGQAGGKIWFFNRKDSLIAYDADTLNQTKGTGSNDSYLSLPAGNYCSFYVDNNTIYSFETKLVDEQEYTVITAYDSVKLEIIGTREIARSRYMQVEE